ncbi:MAG: contractile injection system tape measure protein, partial [Chitinophagales bacterium]
MPPLKHSILKKQLDIELPDKASSHQWMERLSRLGNGVLMRALDETLTQLDLHPNHIERYDRIELDLGNIAAESFEKEFVEKLREALKAHVYLQRAKRQLEHYSNDGVGQHFPIGQSRMDLLSHFLRKGWLPWWYQASSYGSITNILQESLEKQPKMLVALLQKLQKQQQEDIIGRRLTWQFPLEQLQKLVQLLAPKADLSVLAYLQQIQKWKSKLKIKVSTQQFKQDLFRFTLDYLARKNGVVVMEQFKTYLQTTLTDTYQLSKKQQKKWLKAMERTPTAKTWTALEILTFFLENAYLPSNANLQNSQELANLYETVLETESQVFLQWLLGKQLENGKQKRRKKTRRLILQRFVNQLNWLVLLPHLVGQQLGKQLTAYYDYMLKEWSGQEWISSALQWKNSIGIFTILYFGTNKKHTTDHFAGYQISLKAHLIQTFTLPESTIGQLSKMETAFHDSKLKKQKKLEEQNTKAFQEKQERSKKQLASKAFSDAVNKVAEIGGESLKKETSELAFKQELAPHEGKKSTGKQDALKAVNGDIAIPLATNKRITPKTNWFQDTPQLSVFASLEHYLETGFFPENTAKIFQQLTFDTIFYELLTDSPEALFALLQKKTTKARKIERWAAPLRTTTLKTLVKYLQPNWFGFIETLSLALQTYLKNKKYSLSIDKTRTQTKGKVIWQLLVEVLLFQKNSTNLRELLLHVLQRLSSEIRQTEWAISTELLTWLATKGTQSRFTPLTHLLQQIEGQLSNQLKQTSSTKTDISNTQSNVLNTPSESPSTSSKSSDTQVGSSLAESGADSLKNQKTKKQGSKSLILNAKNDEFRVKDELSLLRFFLLYGYYPEKIAAGLSQQTPNDLFTKSMVNQANKLIALLTTIPEQQIVIQRLIAQIDTPQLYQLFEKIHPKQILFLKGMHDVLRLFMLKQNIEQAVLKTLLWQTVLETLLRSKKAKQVNVYWLEQTLKALSTNLQI